eukprot:CAMPEP_0174852588 /NCGR_PEP_ID=MMETSP1114-20130205/25963_1 /TAXON_ID=312471 /ORGANISM="Neobodo designis, Strain CCAP 1951/1" /LENGTH=245 /DNA_ID=CAMNT_0016087195 /DNA_START=89 /DNA_END=826 /DNA_ORIENTATION=+
MQVVSTTTTAATAAVFATARGSPPPLEGVDAVTTNPVTLIQRWIEEARSRGEREPESFSLATCHTNTGVPTVRPMLLKRSDADTATFTFATNGDTEKAHARTAAMCFHWKSLARMARVEGPLTRRSIDAPIVHELWSARSRASKIASWASPQSRVALGGRDTVIEAIRAAEAKFNDVSSDSIPPPPHFGVFDVAADRIEFWTSLRADGFHSDPGDKDRIGERVAFLRSPTADATKATWASEYLFP